MLIDRKKTICYHFAFLILKNEKFKKISEIKKSHKVNNLLTSQLANSVSCSSAKYKGCIYSVGDFIMSNDLNKAYKILEISVKESSDELFLVTGSYTTSFNELLRLYRICENENIIELKQMDDFQYPPLSSIRFGGYLYVCHSEF